MGGNARPLWLMIRWKLGVAVVPRSCHISEGVEENQASSMRPPSASSMKPLHTDRMSETR